MKKSLLLIPSLVALTATPFIGFTSCKVETGGGGDTPEPTPPEPTPPDPKDYRRVDINKEWPDDDDYICAEQQTYEKDDKVMFVCDLNAFVEGKIHKGSYTWTFSIESNFQYHVSTYTVDAVYIDDVQLTLTEVDTLEDLKEGEYCRYSVDDNNLKITYPCYKTIESKDQNFYFFVTFDEKTTQGLATFSHWLE